MKRDKSVAISEVFERIDSQGNRNLMESHSIYIDHLTVLSSLIESSVTM